MNKHVNLLSCKTRQRFGIYIELDTLMMQVHTAGAAVLLLMASESASDADGPDGPTRVALGKGKDSKVLPSLELLHTHTQLTCQLPGQIPQIISDNYCLPYRFSSGEIEISTRPDLPDQRNQAKAESPAKENKTKGEKRRRRGAWFLVPCPAAAAGGPHFPSSSN